MIFLPGCFLQSTGIGVSETFVYYVLNNKEPDPEQGINADDIICAGGLKGKVSTGETLLFESRIIKQGEPDYSENVTNPEGFRKGSPMKIESWCYNEDGTEQGYFLYEDNVVGGPLAFGITFYNYKVTNDCLKPTSSSGEPSCVFTSLF